jgi:hypothetical protein
LAAAALLLAAWQRHQGAWIAGAAGLSLVACAIRLRQSATELVYLQAAPPVGEAWEILPGVGIGPLRLGKPGPQAVALLRRAHVICREDGGVLYILRHRSGWTAVAGISAAPEDRAAPPDPARLLTITSVRTSSPQHSAPGGLRVGRPLAENGPPCAGLCIGERDGVVVWLSVVEPGLGKPISRRG